MAEKNYQQMSEDIINLVGGKDNILKASHCFTRLRLDLKDTSKADLDGLKKVKGTTRKQRTFGETSAALIGTAAAGKWYRSGGSLVLGK